MKTGEEAVVFFIGMALRSLVGALVMIDKIGSELRLVIFISIETKRCSRPVGALSCEVLRVHG